MEQSSIEYRSLVTHRSVIEDAISFDVVSFGARLAVLGIISSGKFTALLNSPKSERDRAEYLMSLILDTVKTESDRYHVFINVLLENWDQHDVILRGLHETYQSLAIEEHAKLDQSSFTFPILTTGIFILAIFQLATFNNVQGIYFIIGLLYPCTK